MKSVKKCVIILLCAAITASMCGISAQAAWGDYRYNCEKLAARPVFDGVINDGEYGKSQWIKFDSSVDAGHFSTEEAIGFDVRFIFGWMDDGVYIGVTVDGDTTPNQDMEPEEAGLPNQMWWSVGDMVQVFFNPGHMVKGASPVLFNIGFNKGGKPDVNRGGYHSTEAEAAPYWDMYKGINSHEGYSTAYNNGKYCVELFIPWSEILINGMDRDNKAVTDLTKWKPVTGAEIGVALVYCDVITPGTAEAYRSDISVVSLENGWESENMGSICLTLTEPEPIAEAVEEIPAVVEDNAPVPEVRPPAATAPQTGDAGIAILVAAIFAAGAFAAKKRFVKPE